MPTRVNLGGARKVAAFGDQTCALVGPFLDCWGLVSGSSQIVGTPADVGPGDTKAIAVGGDHDCAIRSGAYDGELECWDANEYGQLGDGTLNGRLYSAPVVWP